MATDRDRTLADRVADRVVDRTHGHQLQVHPQLRFDGSGGGAKNFFPEHGPTAGQVLVVLTGLPVGSTLLALSGFTLLVTLIGLALAAPLFVIFSPIIVPAVVVIGLAVTAILTAGAFGITALSSLSWVVNSIREAIYVRQGEGILPVEEAKRRVQDMTNYVGQKTKDLGQGIQNTAHTGIGVGGGDRDRRST